MNPTAAFDPLRILKTLDRHAVHFVVIGGIAGRLWGSTTVTNDLDICYGRDRSNRQALAAALRELKVKLPDQRDLELRGDFTITTSRGNLACFHTPRGSAGYDAIARTATRMDVGGVSVLVAALEDLIQMKRAAGSPKDLIELEILCALREELEEAEASPPPRRSRSPARRRPAY